MGEWGHGRKLPVLVFITDRLLILVFLKPLLLPNPILMAEIEVLL